MSDKTFKFMVSGRVQGVGYRAFVYSLAARYRLLGLARNLFNGQVEVILTMPSDLVDEIAAGLKKGPPLSNVREVNVEEIEFKKFSKFQIG